MAWRTSQLKQLHMLLRFLKVIVYCCAVERSPACSSCAHGAPGRITALLSCGPKRELQTSPVRRGPALGFVKNLHC